MENVKNINPVCDIKSGRCAPGEVSSKSYHETTVQKDNSLKLIYYYDPLCGWCYGFSPVITQLKEHFGDLIKVEVVSGGLFLGNRAGLVNEVAPHIRAGAYKQVENLTGVTFGPSFLADVLGEGKTSLNSLPPTIALCIVKEKFPEQELRFAAMLLKAVYYDGLNSIDIDGYADYAAKVGFDEVEFKTKMREDKYKAKAFEEFEKFSASPYNSMPGIVIEQDSHQIPLARGYTDFEKLRLKIEPFLNK